jgi:hypothetical protein
VGVKLEKFPLIVPLTDMLVGIKGSIWAHKSIAFWSLGRIDAGCQIGGKLATAADTGAYVYGSHSKLGSEIG